MLNILISLFQRFYHNITNACDALTRRTMKLWRRWQCLDHSWGVVSHWVWIEKWPSNLISIAQCKWRQQTRFFLCFIWGL